jgi:predicted unusual protein kinase regulating ubiquinone biosynthesis (AarF/ABC1/UbiB family)
MPSDGDQSNNDNNKAGFQGGETKDTVSSIRDSLESPNAKKKEKPAEDSGPLKAKKAKLDPLKPKEEKLKPTFERPQKVSSENSSNESSRSKKKAQGPFVRPKIDYRFDAGNKKKRNRSFRGYAPHRKLTRVEYDDAIKQYEKNRIASRREAIQDSRSNPEYSETDYIRMKQEAFESVKRPRFRAIRAHTTSIMVISSFLFFRLTAVFRTEKNREEAYSRVLKKNAKRLYNTAVKVQGLFVKFGQLMSVVSFAIPEEFREELEALQDKVPQRSVENIIKRIESDLGRPIDRVFSNFNAEALAAASLAQVHEARLKSGERVAVKVQHIGIEREVKEDLRTFRQIVKLTDFFLDVRGLKRAQEQIDQAIMDELDYAKEAKHLSNFHKNFSHDKNIHVPKVYTKYCSEHVLVMGYVEGIKANDYKKLDDLDIDRKLVARRILEAFCQMVFKDGLIHGDPHPGNILVNDDASITLIDFGSVVELSPILRQGIIDLVFGGLTHNTRRIMSGLRKVKYLTPQADEALVEKLIDYFYEFILEGGLGLDNFSLDQVEFDQELATGILRDLHHLDISYSEIKESFQLPRDIMMMGRMLIMLGGLVYEIDPDLKPFEVIRPYLQRFVLSGSGDWQSTVRGNVLGFGMGALQTVDNARYVIEKAKRGDLQVNVKDERKRRYLHYYLFQQFLSILMAGVSGGGAFYLWFQGETLLAQLGAATAFGFLWSAARATKSAKIFRR